MSIRDGLRTYYCYFGVRGVAAISAFRLFGWPKEITTQPRGIRNPLRLRIRTSDILVYGDILLRGEYGLDLPFSPKAIVDAGANVGMASIYFAHRYPEAKIIAIEAEASNFALLADNVRPYPAITPVHAALWNRDGQIGINEPDPAIEASGNWAFVTCEGTGVEVRAVTMATLMRETGISSFDLIKMDIEGSEIEVFEDAEWLDGAGCVMVELHDRFRPGCTEAVERAMRGFKRILRHETMFYVRSRNATATTIGSS